jgi:hypothetical protein
MVTNLQTFQAGQGLLHYYNEVEENTSNKDYPVKAL